MTGALHLVDASVFVFRAYHSVPISIVDPDGNPVNALHGFGRFGDFSYGIYIVHFPVVQTLVYLGIFAWSPYAALVLTCGHIFRESQGRGPIKVLVNGASGPRELPGKLLR